jgi:hypothetical protein
MAQAIHQRTLSYCTILGLKKGLPMLWLFFVLSGLMTKSRNRESDYFRY